MENKEKSGFLNLAKKSFAVLTASLGSLLGNQTKAFSPNTELGKGDTDINFENLHKKLLKPQLILKLNLYDPENSLVSMHSSHRSHSSHSSHRSHSSHSSHYSSSPSYTPSNSTPTYTPSTITPSYVPIKPPQSSSSPTYVPSSPKPITPSAPGADNSETLTYYTLGSRVMYKGCEGSDVKELQKLLLKLKYDVPVTGYFGEKTDIAVKKFQTTHELRPDGRVNTTTLALIQTQ